MNLTEKFESAFMQLPYVINRSRTLLLCGPAIRVYAELCWCAAWTAEAMWAVTTPVAVLRRRLGISPAHMKRALRLLRDVGLSGKTENGCRAVLNPNALTWAHVFLLWPSYLTETQTAALAAMISSGVVPAVVAASLLSEKTAPWEGCDTPECMPFRIKVDVEVVKITRAHVCTFEGSRMYPANSLKTDISDLKSTGYTLSLGGSHSSYIRESHTASPSAPLAHSNPLISEPEKEATPMREDPREIAKAAMQEGKRKEAKAKSKKITPGVLVPVPTRKKKASSGVLPPLNVEQAGSWTAFEWARFISANAGRNGKGRAPLWLDVGAKRIGASSGVSIGDVYANVDNKKKAVIRRLLTPLTDFIPLFCTEAFSADGPEQRTKLARFFSDHLLPRWEYFCLQYLGPVTAAKNPQVHPAYLSAVLPKLLAFYAESMVTKEDFNERMRRMGITILKADDTIAPPAPVVADPKAESEAKRLRELEKEANW